VNESIGPQIENVSSVKKKISFDVPWENVKEELDAVYQKIGKTAKIKGFRSGKIPRNILERYYSPVAAEETAFNVVNRHYWETIQKNKIPVVSQPQIDHQGIESGKNFTFTATVEVEPVVEPTGYIGLDLEKPVPVVTEAEVEANMEQMRQMFAVLESVDEGREVRNGDFVTIGFEGMLEGKKLPELQAENYLLEVGSKKFIPGFEEQMLGLKKGEQKGIEVHFPEDYQPVHLAGKDVAFSVAVKDIRVKKLPELNEQFLKNFDQYSSLEELRTAVKKRIEDEKKRRFQTLFERDISNKLLEKNVFDVPDSFIELQISHMVEDTHERMVSEGLDSQKAQELATSLRDHFRDEAVKIVKTSLLLDLIAQKESIVADDLEVENRIKEFADQRSQDYQAFRKSMEKDGLIEHVRSAIINLKTYEFIESKANVVLRELEKVPSGGSEQ
jgi:trigger factor